MVEYHSIKKEEVIKNLDSQVSGLEESEAKRRLEEYGLNELKQIYKVSPIKIFFKQFNNFLIYVLLAAIVISLLIRHYIDASVILVIVLLNASLGFFQQYKAEQSIIKLKQLFIPQAKVFRNNKLQLISSKEVVPGDIILFEEGDKVLADCRIIEAENLELNEAVLTGESNPVEKIDTIIKQDGIISERINMLYTGTMVVKGKAKAIVVSTGMETEFGKIALKLQEIHLPETPMQKKLDKFAKQVTLIAIVLAGLLFALGTFYGEDKFEMLLTAIVLAVSAIPEGLPAIITITLAMATNKMLKGNVLIRRLPVAETLGSITVICSDKTGTMTEEKMRVVEVFCNNKLYHHIGSDIALANQRVEIDKEKELFNLVKTSILASNARFEECSGCEYKIIGDPTEQALVSLAVDLGVNRKILTELEPRIKEISFSSERKMMSILRESIRRNVLYSKGAPSSILDKASFEFKEDGIFSISPRRKQELKRTAETMEKKGYRVLAFSYKYLTDEKNLEQGTIFLGFMALLDPPRKEISQAIELCRNAGIKVKMITGDSLLTAETVGKQIGIHGRVVGGQELMQMSDKKLADEIENISIFARIDPKQKLRIVEILMGRGEQVAITGDGVNDILALKRADIGIAMGKRGSDVSRDVSDMILLDDNFLSIVRGIEQGRLVYDNTKKATKFLLAANMGEMVLIFFTILLKLPLPVLPLQILWVNLVTDSFPAFALTREEEENLMSTKPRKEASILSGILPAIIGASIISVISNLILIFLASSLDKTRTMVMFSMIIFETFFAFSCRSNKPIYKLKTNKYLWYAVLVTILLQLLLIFTPLAHLFKIVPLTGIEWIYVSIAGLSGFVLFELWKLFKHSQK